MGRAPDLSNPASSSREREVVGSCSDCSFSDGYLLSSAPEPYFLFFCCHEPFFPPALFCKIIESHKIKNSVVVILLTRGIFPDICPRSLFSPIHPFNWRGRFSILGICPSLQTSTRLLLTIKAGAGSLYRFWGRGLGFFVFFFAASWKIGHSALALFLLLSGVPP